MTDPSPPEPTVPWYRHPTTATVGLLLFGVAAIGLAVATRQDPAKDAATAARSSEVSVAASPTVSPPPSPTVIPRATVTPAPTSPSLPTATPTPVTPDGPDIAAMSDDDIVADFERHVTDAGFGDGSEQPGGYFDDCGGPSDPDVTSYIYDNVRGEVAVLTVFPTDERAAVSGERLLSLSTPCDAYPGLVIRETRRLGPASYLVVWGVAGDDDSVFHERYDVNDRLIVVVSGNASRLEPLADLVLSWQPGVDGSSATARVSPPPSPPVPTPLPTVARDLAFVRTLPAGAHTVDVLEGVTITLSEPRPVFLLEGLAGIYLDETYRGEVDIFHVYATSDGDRISSLADAVAYVESDPTFAGLSLVDEGPRTRTYSGTANESDTGFITGPRGVAAGDPSYWYAPNNLRITFIERPQGVIAITGEALAADADRFALAIPLMIELLDSMIVS